MCGHWKDNKVSKSTMNFQKDRIKQLKQTLNYNIVIITVIAFHYKYF